MSQQQTITTSRTAKSTYARVISVIPLWTTFHAGKPVLTLEFPNGKRAGVPVGLDVREGDWVAVLSDEEVAARLKAGEFE